MEILMTVLATAWYAAVPALGVAWTVERIRSRRRNAGGGCAVCARSWSKLDPTERYLLHGRLVCERCAQRTRKRLGWQLGLLTGAAAFASILILTKEGPTLFALLPPATVGLMMTGAVGLMKLANRRAQEAIASGAYAFLLRGEADASRGNGADARS